ncbi:Aste57867_10086 [Aphanomyces stellatus]|uniref:Aste57867_10086 protein n=1 Tax=Aphanomyces stellatus TaxID=120398 RepID=A0A485KPX9_9STRA|nr:hypothetical protein As57867_010047 [Aphanomyces stellatus]VFT86962.1 Aste57867_10086 [Aphanomyces stellatus]
MTPHTTTGEWPIFSATTAATALELLRSHTLAQLQYLFEHRKSHAPKLLQVLNWIASSLPLFDFLQATIRADPQHYLASLFLQRFRKCLRLDLKLDQLKLIVTTVRLAPPGGVTLRVPDEAHLWATLSTQGYAVSHWRQHVAFEVGGKRHATSDAYIWSVLALQLHRLGPLLFTSPPPVFALLGRILAHMVLMGQRLPLAIFPPPFLSTPPEFKPDLAAQFKAGFETVLPNVLDSWNGYERFVLLHQVLFPNTMELWKAQKIRYDAPFSPHHPTIVSLWDILERRLVPDEQTMLRLKWGQPLTIRPASGVGMVTKAVFGLPETTTFDRLHLELMLYVRGFRKQAKAPNPSSL